MQLDADTGPENQVLWVHYGTGTMPAPENNGQATVTAATIPGDGEVPNRPRRQRPRL
jgi:hypothetical protein